MYCSRRNFDRRDSTTTIDRREKRGQREKKQPCRRITRSIDRIVKDERTNYRSAYAAKRKEVVVAVIVVTMGGGKNATIHLRS